MPRLRSAPHASNAPQAARDALAGIIERVMLTPTEDGSFRTSLAFKNDAAPLVVVQGGRRLL